MEFVRTGMKEAPNGIVHLESNEGFNQLFLPAQFLAKKEEPMFFDVTGWYSFETKIYNIKSEFNLDVSPSFMTILRTTKVRREGVLLEVVLSNNSKYIMRNIRLEVIPSKNYVVDEAELHVADLLLPSTKVSSVYGLELQRGDNSNETKEVDRLYVKWSTGFQQECKLEIDTSVLNKQNQMKLPVAISMIGSPQTNKLLTPFTVKFDIHNTSNEERSFIIQVECDNDYSLLPYGTHVFETDVLRPNGSQRISIEFIGLQQGLLPYPELKISTSNYKIFSIDPENGVLILANDEESQ